MQEIFLKEMKLKKWKKNIKKNVDDDKFLRKILVTNFLKAS